MSNRPERGYFERQKDFFSSLLVLFPLLLGVLEFPAAWKAFFQPAISVAPTKIAATRLALEGQTAAFTVTNNSDKTLYEVQVIVEAEKPEISLDHIDVRPVLERSNAFSTKLGNLEIDMRVAGFVGTTESGHQYIAFLVYSLEPGKSLLFSLRARQSIRLASDGHISFTIARFLEEPGRTVVR